MSSSADGWLQQKVPTALFIFSSSSPLNWSRHIDTQDLDESSKLFPVLNQHVKTLVINTSTKKPLTIQHNDKYIYSYETDKR